MTLPDFSEGKYDLLKEGKYTFRITDPPEMRRFGGATGIILKFTAISELGEMENSSVVIFPFPDRDTGYHPYKILKEEIVKSNEEADWVGRSFLGEIKICPHPTKEGQEIQKIVNIEPFPTDATDTTPPPEEEGDPGPEEMPGEEETRKEKVYEEKEDKDPPF